MGKPRRAPAPTPNIARSGPAPHGGNDPDALDALDAPGAPDRQPARPRRWLLMARWVLGLVIGAVAVEVAVHAAGGLRSSWSAIDRLSFTGVAAALVVETASYVLLGARFRRVIGATVISRAEGIELGLVLSGFGLLTPARPAEGLALVGAHLRRAGLSRRRVTVVLGLSEWVSARVFLLLSAVNVFVVALIERDPIGQLWPFLAAAAGVIALLALTAPLVTQPDRLARAAEVLGRLRRRHRDRAGRGSPREPHSGAWYREASELAGPPGHRLAVAALTAGAVLADVACLWFALLAAGADVGFDVALLAITVSSVSVFVPMVPGGIGIVEATIPAVAHHFGVPYDQGLAAALAYRGLGTFLPAVAGACSIVALRLRPPRSLLDGAGIEAT